MISYMYMFDTLLLISYMYMCVGVMIGHFGRGGEESENRVAGAFNYC